MSECAQCGSTAVRVVEAEVVTVSEKPAPRPVITGGAVVAGFIILGLLGAFDKK